MDEEEYEEYEYYHPTRPFRREDLLVLGLDLMAGISRAVTNTLTTAEALVAAHANYKIDREAFHEEAALELETLIAGEDEDA